MMRQCGWLLYIALLTVVQGVSLVGKGSDELVLAEPHATNQFPFQNTTPSKSSLTYLRPDESYSGPPGTKIAVDAAVDGDLRHGAGTSSNVTMFSISTAAESGRLGSPSSWYIGVLLEAFGQLINVLSKHAWRSVGKRYSIASTGERWFFSILGLTGVITYVVADVLALRFTSQSIVSACDGMAIFWNNLLAPFTLNERLTTTQVVACVLILMGTVGAAFSGSHAQDQPFSYYITLLREGPAIGYYVSIFLFLGILSFTLYQRRVKAPEGFTSLPLASTDATGGFIYAAIAGSIAGNAFLTKVASSILTLSPDPFGNGFLYIFSLLTISIHAAALGMLYIGLRRFEAILLVTTLDAFNILIGALSGSFVLQEIYSVPAGNIALFFFSICFILLGMSLLLKFRPFGLNKCLDDEDEELSCLRNRDQDNKVPFEPQEATSQPISSGAACC